MEKEGRFSTQVTDTALIIEGGPHGANETTTEALEVPKNQQEDTLRPKAHNLGERERKQKRELQGKSPQLQGSPGSKSSQEKGTPHMFEPQGRIQGTAYGIKRAQKIVHNNPEMPTEPKASGESQDHAQLHPPTRPEGDKQGRDGRSIRRREEGAEKKKGGHGGQGTGEDRRRSGQEQEPTDEFKPRTRAWIGQ